MRERLGRKRRVAVSAKIGRQHREVVAEVTDLRLSPSAVGRSRVQQQHCWAAAG